MWPSPMVKNSTHHSNLLQNYLQPSTKLARILCSLLRFMDVTIEGFFIKGKYTLIRLYHESNAIFIFLYMPLFPNSEPSFL